MSAMSASQYQSLYDNVPSNPYTTGGKRHKKSKFSHIKPSMRSAIAGGKMHNYLGGRTKKYRGKKHKKSRKHRKSKKGFFGLGGLIPF
jgi:hypothetical protein